MEALGIRAIAADMGWDLKIKLRVDSSAAKSMAARTGLGKTRHIEPISVGSRSGSTAMGHVHKVKGIMNVSDILTKPKGKSDLEKILNRINIFF